MKIKGIDTAATVTAAAAEKLKAEGYSFAGRYLAPTTGASAWKGLRIAEAQLLRDAGIAILLIWETTALRAKSGSSGGSIDGARAAVLAQELGVPETAVIYFAVDFNAQKADYSAVEAYLKAARSAVAPYSAGVYGSRSVCDEMQERGAVRYFMQCCAWSSGLSEHADVYQWQWQEGAEAKEMAAKLGFAVDLCRARSTQSAGMWLPGYNHYDDGEGGVVMEPAANNTQGEPWYQDAMDWAKAEGLILDGRPNDPVTRAELATVLQRAFTKKEDAK